MYREKYTSQQFGDLEKQARDLEGQLPQINSLEEAEEKVRLL